MKLPEKIEAKSVTLIGLTKPSFELATELYKVVDGSRDSLREWLPWPDKTKTPEDEYNYLVNWAQAHWKEGTGFAYIIVSPKDEKKILGCIDLCQISETNQSGEIGYWLSDEAAGHGYMQEALCALEDAAFKAGINRIVIRNDIQNKRSVNVTERAGYVLEGIMRQDHWNETRKCLTDTNIWAKLRADWIRKNKLQNTR